MSRKIYIYSLLFSLLLASLYSCSNNEEENLLTQAEDLYIESMDSTPYLIEVIGLSDQNTGMGDSVSQEKGAKSLAHLKQLYIQEKTKNKENNVVIKNQRYLLAIGSIIILVLISIDIVRRLRNRRSKDGQDKLLENKDKTIVQYQISLKQQLDMYKDMVELSLSPRSSKYERFLTDYNQVVYNREGVFEFDWEIFNQLFTRVFNDCAERLKDKYPQLTEKERQVVLLQKGGFEISTIAEVQNLSIHTIYRRNSEIRKKLGVPDSENLIKYLDAQFK